MEENGEYSKEFGINSRSVLLELEHFDMCSGTLVPDVMHDLLEGSLQHIIVLIIKYLTEEKRYFRLSYLNQRIEEIELGYMEDNRPSKLSKKDKTLRQNGMPMYMYICKVCTCTYNYLTSR